MLAHLKLRAQEEGVKVETVEADMNNFKLRKKCDFAFVLSGSLYVDSNKQFLKHLDCVAEARLINFKHPSATIIVMDCFEAAAWRKKPYAV
ncbi:MAG: hypothetical protein QMD23_07465, partial [Candidatus Bathyarchaeia archaeon]|nr:hypothetical protein [Candidatus Bathyarchaeia archaeon]